MKTEELKAKGLTDDQISFVMSENGKDISKLQKDKEKLEGERDQWKTKAETAEETLKGFEGIDPAKIQEELESWKEKAEEAEKNAQAQLYERDFNDALREELDKIEFSSTAAKRSVTAQIKEAGLKLKDGQILGLSDLVEQIKKEDSAAFIDEGQQQAQQNAAKFTQKRNQQQAPGGTTKEDFRKMSLDQRTQLKQTDPELYNNLKG